MLNHCLQWDHTYYTVAGGRSIAYIVLVWSRLNPPVELSTTPDTTMEIGSMSATVE